MLCRTLVRPPYGTKASPSESRVVRTYVCSWRGFCGRMASINAAALPGCRGLASQGAVPTGWHFTRRDDGRTGHDGEAAADSRGHPRVHVRTGVPAVGAGDRRARRPLVVVDGA